VDAFTNHFDSHRGVWHYEDLDVLVVYSNHPYDRDPLLRDWELDLLLGKLAAFGVTVHARASYPDDGYTVALVLDARGDRQSLATRLYEESINQAAVTAGTTQSDDPPGGGKDR
jgi:hypothetical protein